MPEKNILNKLGLPYTDQELAAEFGLDINGDIDSQMYDYVENRTYEANVASGMDEEKARAAARKNRETTMRNHQMQLKKQQ